MRSQIGKGCKPSCGQASQPCLTPMCVLAARLHLAKVWTSSRPPKLPVTVVTHTQTNRDKHINQCRTWRGPLVASVYMPIAQSGGTELGPLQQQQVQNTIEELDMLHAK